MEDFLWVLAIVVDVVHLFIVLPLLAVGHKLIGQRLHGALLLTTFSLQLAFLSCPLTDLSRWLRSFKRPSLSYDPGLTEWAYSHFGAISYSRFIISALSLYAAALTVHGWYAERYKEKAPVVSS